MAAKDVRFSRDARERILRGVLATTLTAVAAKLIY